MCPDMISNSSFNTLSVGTIALVVHEAAPRISSSSIIAFIKPCTIFLIPNFHGDNKRTLEIHLQFR